MTPWRVTEVYKPGQKTSFKLSRSKIELFIDCPRCFWLDRRLGIKRPDGPPFQINKAIDELLKTEFDTYRKRGEPHPYMAQLALEAIPFRHEQLDAWRNTFTGVQALHIPTNLLVFGAVDDIWVNPAGELIVVDYKATAKKSQVSLDAEWQNTYKRQMEVYQWLLRANGFQVHPTGYFVYANGISDAKGFFNKVDFTVTLLAYTGDDSWVEPTLNALKACLESATMPEVGPGFNGDGCEFCNYARSRTELTVRHMQKTQSSIAKP